MFFKVFSQTWESDGLSFGISQTSYFPHQTRNSENVAGIKFYMSAKDALAGEYSPENKIALVIPEPEGALIWGEKISYCEALRVIKELTWGDIFSILQTEELYPELVNAFSNSLRNIPDKYQIEVASYFYGWNKNTSPNNGMIVRDNLGKEQKMTLSTHYPDNYKGGTIDTSSFHQKENIKVCN